MNIENVKKCFNTKKELSSKESQKRYHYYSFNFMREVIGIKSGEIDFFYRLPNKRDLKKFDSNKIDSFFSIDIKNPNIAKVGVNEILKEFLLAQECLVNETSYEQNIIEFIRGGDFSSKTIIEKNILEQILFLHWRARKTSYDFNSFSRAKFGINYPNNKVVKHNEIIEEQSDIFNILSFCFFPFAYLDINIDKLIQGLQKKSMDIMREGIKWKVSNLIPGNNEIEKLDSFKKFQIDCTIANDLKKMKTDNITMKNNIKQTIKHNYDLYMLDSEVGFPLTNEPYGTISNSNGGEIIEKIDYDYLKITFHYIAISINKIIIFVPNDFEGDINKVIKLVTTCIFNDPDILLLSHKNKDVLNELNLVYAESLIDDKENYKNIFDKNEKYYKKIWEIFNPNITKIE